MVAEIEGLSDAPGGNPDPPLVVADLVVFLGRSAAVAERRKANLDGLFGHVYRSDASVFVGTPLELADLIEEWSESGLDGVRLRPGGIPDDLELIGDVLVPELRAAPCSR